jgi:hypothetical protein
MFRSQVIKKFRYTNKYRFAEDYELWFKVSEKYKLGNLQEYLSYTRATPSENLEENIKEKRTNTIELLSEQLDKLGLEHTQRELAIHIAIIFGYGKRYFNTPQKQKELKTWIKKVLDALKKKNHISNSIAQSVFYSILENYCGI